MDTVLNKANRTANLFFSTSSSSGKKDYPLLYWTDSRADMLQRKAHSIQHKACSLGQEARIQLRVLFTVFVYLQASINPDLL